MIEVTLNNLTQALMRMQPGFPVAIVTRQAAQILEQVEPALYPALRSWLNAQPVGDFAHGEFTLQQIVGIRGDGDYLNAIVLMSKYMRDEKVGRALILAPRR